VTRSFALVFLAAVACSSEPDPSPSDASTTNDAEVRADSGPMIPDAGPAERVEIGTGENEFMPVMTGQRVDLVAGPQGGSQCFGYHVWFAARAFGLEPRNAMVRFSALGPQNREDYGTQERMITLQPSGGGYGIWGIAVRLKDCCLVEDADVIMRVEITDTAGKMVSDERVVRGASSCPQIGGTASICQNPITCP
jgi:hypothetical protein